MQIGQSKAADESRIKDLTLKLLAKILPEHRAFAVRLWDGTTLPATAEPSRATLVLTKSDTLGRVLNPPLDLALGEAYLQGDLEIEGDLEAVFEVAENIGPRLSPLDWVQLARQATALRKHARKDAPSFFAQLPGRQHSRERDRQAVQYHYDLSNRFYELWLDRRLVYSCGYFPDGNETLDEAQAAKLELICRKLRLKPGEQLLDIGCGWGGLVLYAAKHYGVKALGVTLSERQLEEARRRIAAAGLEDSVTVELLDYRDLQGEFDKIASIGMAEHVGGKQLKAYFQAAWERLRAGGLMLNHAISQGPPRAVQISSKVISGQFIERYVFPDHEIMPIWQTLQAAQAVGFEVRDVESWREHYAQTLRHWARNLDENWEAAVAEVGFEKARVTRLYLSATAYQFNYGQISIHQSLLAKPDAHGRVALPPSRADLYREGPW